MRLLSVRKVGVLTTSKNSDKQYTQFAFDLNTNPFFKKDYKNFINILGAEQLNSLQQTSLLDIFLSENSIIEPHYHQNAAELTYCISGSANVSLLNPNTKELQSFSITAGQVVNVPRGWWHFQIATSDNTHLLGIFDAPTPEVILASDILTLTPSTVFSYSYCLNDNVWKNATASIKSGMLIGPPNDCNKTYMTPQNNLNTIPPNDYPPYRSQQPYQGYERS